MYIPLKLGAIEQQHLQELYELAGVPRDELPYSPALTQVCADFQDRTFKNANEAQVFGALLKYVRSSRCAKAPRKAGKKDNASPEAPAERLEQARLLRAQRASLGKIQPYTSDFESARAAFARSAGAELSPKDFWLVVQLAGAPGGAAKAKRLQPQPA